MERSLKVVSPPIRMRTGIHTGNVIVGTLGNDLRVEFKAVGDTVNLASRMEGLAEPDSVYVTEETYQLTKKLFKFVNLGTKSVKGKKTAVAVHKALSAKEDVYRPRLGEERMIFSEMWTLRAICNDRLPQLHSKIDYGEYIAWQIKPPGERVWNP